jgi:hypothetical protein
MCASILSVLRSGPPPPKVVLLPDGLFFTRAVPIASGATPAEATSQVELALEALSPFPLAQLYYGWFWVPGAPHAFAYGAYRRRFTTDQIALWADAEIVIPAAVALFGASVQPATTAVIAGEEGLTAVHWESPAVPSRLLFRPLAPDSTEEDRARVRDELLRAAGESRHIIDLAGPPVPEPLKTDREFVFRADELVSRLPGSLSGSLDVRDKGELATFQQARRRDVTLWRVTLGCAAALVLLGLGQLALFGGNQWHRTRLDLLAAQKPTVDKIKASEELATMIDDLVNKRLLPLEMITALVGVDDEHKRKPDDITITRIEAEADPNKPDKLYTLVVDVTTSNAGLVNVYQSQLKSMDEFEDVKVEARQSSGSGVSFRLTIVFKPGALKPATSI